MTPEIPKDSVGNTTVDPEVRLKKAAGNTVPNAGDAS